MANYSIKFHGTAESETTDHSIECFKNIKNNIFIGLSVPNHQTLFICLDKSTAIKLAKTLRTEINKMEDEKNG